MRSIILLICSFFAFTQISLAQNDDSGNIAYPNNFNVNPQISNKIRITNAGLSLDVTGSFGITVVDLFKNYFTELKTNIAVIENGNIVFEIAGPDFKKPADFPNSQTLSTIKNFSVTIPQAIISNIITTYPDAELILRYKFNYNSSSGILPNVGTGWLPQVAFSREYFVHNTKYGFIDDRPRAKITGPDEINTEGTYQVDGAVSFEEVPTSNVYNATLNHLGSGKYIITANPGFIGSITLLAKHSNGLETYKVVQVKGPPLSISGPSVICSEEIYTINSASSVILENATGIASLTHLGGNQYKIIRLSGMSGEVVIKATDTNNSTSTKNIKIGTVVKNSIIGNPTLLFGESNEYYINLEDGITDINWTVTNNPNVVLTKLSNNRVRLSTTGSVPLGTTYNLTLTGRGISSCGTTTGYNASEYVTKNVTFVYDRDPRIE